MGVLNWPTSFISAYMSPLYQIILIWALLFLLMRMVKPAVIFRSYNTFFHEVGHAFMALLTSGSVNRIELYTNAAGIAVTGHKTWISKFLVSLAGYPFASVVGWLFLTYAYTLKQEYVVYVLLGIYILALILWVRNAYGVLWVIGNVLFLAAVINFNLWTWFNWYFFCVGSALLLESVWACFILAYISAENPYEAGDAKNLRDLTFIPAIVWALCFVLVSLFFLNLTIASVFHLNLF